MLTSQGGYPVVHGQFAQTGAGWGMGCGAYSWGGGSHNAGAGIVMCACVGKIGAQGRMGFRMLLGDIPGVPGRLVEVACGDSLLSKMRRETVPQGR
jgi:hypothetical protein